MSPVIIVMVKAPRPGLAKTRLTPPLTEFDAASLATCFVKDVVNSARRIVPNVIVAFSPHDGRDILQSFLPPALYWFEQHGDGLDERLDAAIAYAGNLGFSPIIVLGADSPTLPESFVETARDALADGQADAVLGPTVDGGYYLIGLQKPVHHLFQDIAWSTPLAYRQTARNIIRFGLHLLEISEWYDVDTFSDLLRLRDEVFSDEASRRRAANTYDWFLTHDLPGHQSA
jgi:rSAM/selenodomain-associated transferase 1